MTNVHSEVLPKFRKALADYHRWVRNDHRRTRNKLSHVNGI